MWARSVMASVSRTLWSVMRMPMPFARSRPTISWMSPTAIGARPGKGSSRGRACGAGAAPRAAGERVRGVRRGGGEVQLGEQLARARAPLGAAEVQRLQDGQQVLLDGELAEDRGLLREVADAHPAALVHGQARDLLTLEEDPAALRRQQADHHVEGRGLPRPVGAEQAHDLTTLDVERHVVDDLALLEPLDEPLGDQAFHGSTPSVLAAPPPGPRGG